MAVCSRHAEVKRVSNQSTATFFITTSELSTISYFKTAGRSISCIIGSCTFRHNLLVQAYSRMAARRYILPANEYSGTVAGVSVSYNDHTKRHVQGLANPELKKFLEDAGVTAALSRGFYSVFIR